MRVYCMPIMSLYNVESIKIHIVVLSYVRLESIGCDQIAAILRLQKNSIASDFLQLVI